MSVSTVTVVGNLLLPNLEQILDEVKARELGPTWLNVLFGPKGQVTLTIVGEAKAKQGLVEKLRQVFGHKAVTVQVSAGGSNA